MVSVWWVWGYTQCNTHTRSHTHPHTHTHTHTHVQVMQRWRQAHASVGGKALLEGWGYEGGNVSDMSEELQRLAYKMSGKGEEGDVSD